MKNNELEEKRLELEALASEKEEASTEVSRLKREWAALKKRSEEEVDAVERLKNAKDKAEGELQSIKRQVEEAKREVWPLVSLSKHCFYLFEGACSTPELLTVSDLLTNVDSENDLTMRCGCRKCVKIKKR